MAATRRWKCSCVYPEPSVVDEATRPADASCSARQLVSWPSLMLACEWRTRAGSSTRRRSASSPMHPPRRTTRKLAATNARARRASRSVSSYSVARGSISIATSGMRSRSSVRSSDRSSSSVTELSRINVPISCARNERPVRLTVGRSYPGEIGEIEGPESPAGDPEWSEFPEWIRSELPKPTSGRSSSRCRVLRGVRCWTRFERCGNASATRLLRDHHELDRKHDSHPR
jgi:hypothetical protein